MTVRKALDPVMAENIKRQRKRAGLTQRELAQRLHYSSIDTIKAWERTSDKRSPDLQILMEMCSIFNCSLEDLIGQNAENELYDRSIEKETKDLFKSSKTFIQYLETIGYTVEILPATAISPDNVSYEYRISKKTQDVKCCNQDEWNLLQEKAKNMVQMLIE